MKKVLNTSRVPAGGFFVYVNPEDGWRIKSPYYENAKIEAKKYRRINHYPIGLEWDLDFESNICANTPGENTCIEFTPPTLGQKLAAAANALLRAAKSGFKTVSQDQFDSRMEICKACNFFGGSRGLLKIACQKCGCGGLKIHLATESCPISKW